MKKFILFLFTLNILLISKVTANDYYLLMWEPGSTSNSYDLMKVNQTDGSEELLTSITLDSGISIEDTQCDTYAGKCFIHQGSSGFNSALNIYDLKTNTWSVAKKSNESYTYGIQAYPHFGQDLIRQESDGSIHIGRNSLVTVESGGRQQLYATDATGNRIDINIPSGTNLLIDGEDVMGSIDSSIALGAAFASLPTGAEGAGYTCGLGTGFHDSASAISGGCGFDFANYAFVDSMPELFQKASFNVGAASVIHGEGDDATLKAGITFKFGAPKPVREAKDNNLLLENKIDAVMAKNEAIQNENDLLKAQIAEINAQLKALNMLAMN